MTGRVRRRRIRDRVADEPSLDQRKAWADQHEDLARRLRDAGLRQPGDPHYECNHLRMDDPAWRPGQFRPPPERLNAPNLAPGDDAA